MEVDRKLLDLLKNKEIATLDNLNYKKLGLNFNPFPKAGISDINSSDFINSNFSPVDEDVEQAINEFIIDSLFPKNPYSKDKYISAVIRGDYGYGKTQTLMYIKFLLESFKEAKEYRKSPYVIYIDNPGAKLTELIGTIIYKIGEENFKKYLWNIVIVSIRKNEDYKTQLLDYIPGGYSLFSTEKYDPFSTENTINYKKFIDGWYQFFQKDTRKKKRFQDNLKEIIISLFTAKFQNTTVAIYFYELLSENIGINKTWELLTTGDAKNLEKKEVYIIRAIVDLIHEQGFTDFHILVDEFEAVTTGRLSKSEIDRYVANLRALIDKERNWCAAFSMTGLALSSLKRVSPPLADRITSKVIDLKPLNKTSSNKLLLNYLNLAREKSDSIFPFDESGVDELLTLSNNIHRIFLKSCFHLIQRANENLKSEETINSEFVTKFFQIEEE